ncbi:MAG: RdgB/HAM1 family non-canonical purine NTP pyrophosphatase [Gammaproteobacteria bacterium]
MPEPRLIVATGNPGKQREIGEILRDPGILLVTDAALDMDSVEETGATFVENALLKARYATSVAEVPALADDSGIEVDALRGAPGIYSARYAGPGASDQDNVNKLLHALRDVPEALRTARFRCVMVVLRHASDPAPLICEGSWEGKVAFERRGENGFGYDPVFIPNGMSEHSAELARDRKNRISHRGQALTALAQRLADFLV